MWPFIIQIVLVIEAVIAKQCPELKILPYLHISQCTTTIFRWCCVLTSYTDGVDLFRIERQTFFNTNIMQPDIAEVVFIEKPFTCPKIKGGKKNLFRVVGETDPAIVVNAIVLAMNVELIQVTITPANRNLNCVVEIGDRAVATDKQSAPNHRAYTLERYLQLINMGLFGVWHDTSFLTTISGNPAS